MIDKGPSRARDLIAGSAPLRPAPLHRGAYVARFAQTPEDLRAAQALRHRCFVTDAGLAPRAGGLERDSFDGRCDHVLVEDGAGRVVCCFRVLTLASGADWEHCYSAQYYDLRRLAGFEGVIVELGRFCVAREVVDGDVLRMAWAMLARFVDGCAGQLLIGCASFEGTDSRDYAAAFDLLAARHLAPARWLAGIKAREVVRFSDTARPVKSHKLALGQVPSLLKTYLGMGGWVSDHAVIDRDMNTLHVFTGLEIDAIPPARAAALRAL